MASFRVEGRGGRVVHDEIAEEGLRAWQASVERLVSAGAIVRPEKFRIVPLAGDGKNENWRPRNLPAARLERTGT